MSRRLLGLLVLAFATSPVALHAAEPMRTHVDDPARLLPLDPPAAAERVKLQAEAILERLIGKLG